MGLHRNALGYVIGASINQVNECVLIAVLPQIIYPNIPFFADNEQDSDPPLKKQSKIEPPSYHHGLFNPTHLRIHKPQHALPQSCDLYATIYNDGFQSFFKNKFLDTMSNGETHMFNLDDFTWVVCQREVNTVMTRQSSSTLQTGMEIIPKTPPVYCYCGHFYYLGMRIQSFYQRSSLAVNHLFQFNKILPFVEAHLAPNIFDPLLSQLHWKRGNKLADVMQTTPVLSDPQGGFGRGCCSHAYGPFMRRWRGCSCTQGIRLSCWFQSLTPGICTVWILATIGGRRPR